MYVPQGYPNRKVMAGDGAIVLMPSLALNDNQRGEKIAWVRRNCTNMTDGTRLHPFPNIAAGSYRFGEHGVVFDEEAMAAIFERNPDMSADSKAYNEAFPLKSWEPRC